jgi:hypothetical protein
VLSNALKIVVADKGQLHLPPERRPAKFEQIDQTGPARRPMGLKTSDE